MSHFEKFTPCCSYEPPSTFHEGYSSFELLNTLINMINEFIDYANGLQAQFDEKEDITFLTNNRKLSLNGNFTGTWFNDTKANMDLKIGTNENLYNELLDFYRANPQISVNVYEGKFFATNETIDKIADGGDFNEPYTDEVDCGLFIYPCSCSL